MVKYDFMVGLGRVCWDIKNWRIDTMMISSIQINR